MPQDKIAGSRGPPSALGVERGDGEVHVPATYQSDAGPAISLASMTAAVHGNSFDGAPRRNAEGRAVPLRLTISFDCNAEGVARLAEFFGIYDRERWNAMARERGLPMVAEAEALPAARAPLALPPSGRGE